MQWGRLDRWRGDVAPSPSLPSLLLGNVWLDGTSVLLDKYWLLSTTVMIFPGQSQLLLGSIRSNIYRFLSPVCTRPLEAVRNPSAAIPVYINDPSISILLHKYLAS